MGGCLPHRWQPGLLAFKPPPSALVLPPQGSSGYFSSLLSSPGLQGPAHTWGHAPALGLGRRKRPPWSQVLIPSAQVLGAGVPTGHPPSEQAVLL